MISKADRLLQVSEYYFSGKLAEIASMRSQGKDVINLGIGSPDLAPDDSVVNELIDSASKKENHTYQPYRSTLRLREAIRDYYNNVYHVSLDADTQVLPLLGSKEGIMYISMAFLNPGDEVLIPDPGYPAYGAIAKLIGANVRPYDLLQEKDWLPDLDKLGNENLSNVKLMWVNYPNMPTGASGSSSFFDQLVEFGLKHKLLVCNDNPYSQVLNDEPKSILNHDKELKWVIELNSLSKSFNMAGWRIGMVLGHQSYIDAIIQAKSNVDSGMFRPVQDAASRALELPESWHKERNEIYKKRKLVVIKILDLLNCTYQEKQVGMFVWARLPEQVEDTHGFVDTLLNEVHVFVTPGDVFGLNGKGYIRLSLCSPEEKYEEAIKRLKLWKEGKKQLV